MDLDLAGRQARRYNVHTPLYEGPLDLLLQLIMRAELDITTLALARVTEQYLEHLRALEVSAEEISGFLVVAAKLLQIKSEALLPRPPVREPGEEDPGRALADQLKIYRRYKQIASWLQAREAAGLRSYLRLAPPTKIEGRLDLTDITLADLLAAAEAVYSQEQEKQALGTVITAPKITIREKIALIAERLATGRETHFHSLVDSNPSRLEVVVTFLALLELVKRYRVSARQGALFGEIQIERLEDWEEDEELDLEFE
jgi:segregation and condensation protein A